MAAAVRRSARHAAPAVSEDAVSARSDDDAENLRDASNAAARDDSPATAPDPAPPRKSILKSSAPRGPADLGEPHAHEEDAFDGLFGALLEKTVSVSVVVADWRARHASDQTRAMAELYTLVARAGGCATTIRGDDLDASSADDIQSAVLAEMTAGNLYAEDPMSPGSGSGASKAKFRAFKANYLEFWDKLLRDSSDADDLFDAREEEEGAAERKKRGRGGDESPGAASSSLFDALSDLVALFSSVRARSVRVAATEAGLQLVTSLVRVARAKADARDLAQRQLDAESRKSRPNASMTRRLRESLAVTQAKIHASETMIKGSFGKIFTHRFRDVDPAIRISCMRSIGRWMLEHPLFFLSDYYLKYLGWSLNDKDALVRLAVLEALRELYGASSENLALMDTFNARFTTRVREMIDDVDPRCAAAATRALATLHAAGVLPREHVEPVLALLLDADASIRAAAAEVVPLLIEPDDAEEGDEEDEETAADEIGTSALRRPKKTRRGEKKRGSNSRGDDGTRADPRATLLALVDVIWKLGGTRARVAAAVDALWDVYSDVFTDWTLIFDALLADEEGGEAKKATARRQKQKRNPPKKAAAANERERDDAGLSAPRAALLANVLSCAARKARGDHLLRPEGHAAGVSRPLTKAQRDRGERQREAFTQAATRLLPTALARWRADEAVAAPLAETAAHLKLEHYALKRQEPEFEKLADALAELFRAHATRRVADACAAAFLHAVEEGNAGVRAFARDAADACFEKTVERARETIASAKDAKREEDDEKGAAANARALVELARLNALLSVLPPPAEKKTTETERARSRALSGSSVFDDLVSVVVAAANGASPLDPEPTALAVRAASLLIAQDMHDVVDRPADAAELATGKLDAVADAHVATRDAFVASVVTLAAVATEEEEEPEEETADPENDDAAKVLRKRSRVLPKAAVAAFADLTLWYQYPAALARAAELELAEAREQTAASSGDASRSRLDELERRGARLVALASKLDLVPDEASFRVVWDACNHLLDVPEGNVLDDDTVAEEDLTGDDEAAKLAYALAALDASVTRHGFVAAELLANRGHSGRWTDVAIAALMNDLRRLGPRATGDAVTTSLASAFEEVRAGDPDDAFALEEAFRELAGRLAGMFQAGSARDRVVARAIVEEGLAFAFPPDAAILSAEARSERMPFLTLGLAPFVSKLAATDARALVEPLRKVAVEVDPEDARFAPLAEFGAKMAARARGAVPSGAAAEGAKRGREEQRRRGGGDAGGARGGAGGGGGGGGGEREEEEEGAATMAEAEEEGEGAYAEDAETFGGRRRR